MAGFSLFSVVILVVINSGMWYGAMAGGLVSQLKCYSNTQGTEMKRCQEERGYTSCFTKYDPGGVVTGRGCSDKGSDLMLEFEEDCETFQSKEKTETYCYCPYYLCNSPAESSDTSRQLFRQLPALIVSCLMVLGRISLNIIINYSVAYLY